MTQKKIKQRPRLPAAVIGLGWVSLFTDFSKEMITPLLPFFLTAVLGAGPAALGVVEGCADAAASLLKLVSGRWTDRVARRKPFVLWGYGLSSAARPLIALATVWPVVLLLRVTDRIGKGIRGAPRDAMIADVINPENRGAAFGFHDAMDHAGAVLGPLAAAALLYAHVGLRTVFMLSAIPAAIVVAIIAFGIKEAPRPPDHVAAAPDAKAESKPKPAPQLGNWAELGGDFHWLMAALVVFTLGNSADTFILLRLADAGWSAGAVVLLYAAHHGVKLLASHFGGQASDRIGRRKPMIAGWLFYGVIYLCFACFGGRLALAGIFLAYGIFFGLTEPVEKAWVADMAPKHLRGTAYGFYYGAIGIAALPASLIFGLIWKEYGAAPAFGTGAALAFIATAMLMKLPARLGPHAN